MTKRQPLFGIQIDAFKMTDAVDRIFEWIEDPSPHCEFVVTPNVDHTVILRENEKLQAAYADAGMVLADGHPVVIASRLLRKPLPERVAGSDLVPAIFDRAETDTAITVFLLGAAPGVADRAAEEISKKWPHVFVTGAYSPPLGFENDPQENEKILRKIQLADPDVLIIGLGAPKQELWIHRFQHEVQARVALCVGATIDFLAGEKQRAPGWIQSVGLEWLHRIGTDPKRLLGRYLKDAWVFPQLVWQELRHPTSQEVPPQPSKSETLG